MDNHNKNKFLLGIITEKMEISLSEADMIFIGDSWHDKEAAKKAGLSFVHANDLHSAILK